MFDAAARMPTIVNLPPGVEAIVIISGLSFPRQTPSSSRTQGFTRDLMAQAERDLGTKFELNRGRSPRPCYYARQGGDGRDLYHCTHQPRNARPRRTSGHA